jgi:hypothetical protein
MTRIIPPLKSNSKSNFPKWMNASKVVEAGKVVGDAAEKLTKQASQNNPIVASYFCLPCNKIYSASNAEFIKQASIAKKSNKDFTPLCPNCGGEVNINKQVKIIPRVGNLQSLHTEKRVDLRDSHQRVTPEKKSEAPLKIGNYKTASQKTSSVRGTYNTFIDRTAAFSAIEHLGRYARKQGMTNAVVSYLRSQHSKSAGNSVSTLNDIECKINWSFGRMQKGYATATLSIDEAGRFVFPKVFKVASGMEYPFESKYIKQLERVPALFQSLPTRKKSDTPAYRKPDPSRFRVVGSMKVGEAKASMNKSAGSYDEFLMHYGNEIQAVIKRIKEAHKKYAAGEITQEDINRGLDSISQYEKNLPQYFSSWVMTGDIEGREIADLALDNMNRYGTEMSQVVYALETFCDIMGIYEDEDEDEEEGNEDWIDPAGGIHSADDDDPAKMYE